MNWEIPLFKIYWDEDDVEMVKETIQRGMFWAIGPNIDRLEQMLAEYVGTRYALVFNSGTSALHANLLAYGIGEGDEVIVPSFTFIATANAPLFVGAKPVFADIEEKTFGLDPQDVVRKINSQTKAIMPIHYGGCPCLIEELKGIADKNKLLLIEDAAEAMGANINGKKVATFGDAAILSFCANKVITTGEGGAVLTDSVELYKKLQLIRSHGRVETSNYFSSTESMEYTDLGYNFRMSDITAALGIAQLKKIDKLIEMRRKNSEVLSARLSKINEIEIPETPAGFFHVFQMYTIRVKGGQKTRDELISHLATKGIISKVYFSPIHLSHYYQGQLGYSCHLPVTERVSSQIIALPMYPQMTEPEINFIADMISDFFKMRGID